jgi:hypothetical protein
MRQSVREASIQKIAYADDGHTEMDCFGYVFLWIMHLAPNVVCLIPPIESPKSGIKREGICRWTIARAVEEGFSERFRSSSSGQLYQT